MEQKEKQCHGSNHTLEIDIKGSFSQIMPIVKIIIQPGKS
jgi:hypothetical protein